MSAASAPKAGASSRRARTSAGPLGPGAAGTPSTRRELPAADGATPLDFDVLRSPVVERHGVSQGEPSFRVTCSRTTARVRGAGAITFPGA